MVLVPEVSDTSDDERHAVLVAAVDGVIIPHTPTRLSNNPDAVLARLLNGVVPSCDKLTAQSVDTIHMQQNSPQG
jgi:hypothetical protein